MKDNCHLKKSNVLIYGTGGNGAGLYNRIMSFCKVLGFIDKRAKKIGTMFDKPVFTIDEVSQRLSTDEKQNVIVIITVKNVFIHSEIVKELLNNDFAFFVYKPLNVLKNRGNATEIRINDIYECIVERKEYMENIDIPRTKEILYEFENKLLIAKEQDYVSTWMPVELLFNYKNSYDYPGINMPLFFPLVELYKAFLGSRDVSLEQAIDNFYLYCGEWLHQNEKRLTEEQKDSFLESRVSIFGEMQKMAEVDIKFFEHNAPLVEKENNIFFLKSSGRNRVAFLIAKGFKYVPVKMNINDYNEWCNIGFVNEKEREINQNNVNCFFASYPNPYLVDYPVCFTDYQRLFLQPVANEVMKELYLKNIIVEDNVRRVDFDHVEKDKKSIGVLVRIREIGRAHV